MRGLKAFDFVLPKLIFDNAGLSLAYTLGLDLPALFGVSYNYSLHT